MSVHLRGFKIQKCWLIVLSVRYITCYRLICVIDLAAKITQNAILVKNYNNKKVIMSQYHLQTLAIHTFDCFFISLFNTKCQIFTPWMKPLATLCTIKHESIFRHSTSIKLTVGACKETKTIYGKIHFLYVQYIKWSLVTSVISSILYTDVQLLMPGATDFRGRAYVYALYINGNSQLNDNYC